MPYYIAKVTFETGEAKKNGDPILHTAQFLIPAESVLEVETKLGGYLEGTAGSFETVQITKSKIEAVID